MIISQANLFLIFTIDGVLIGLLFDVFRILRKSFKTADIVTYIEDVIFWILTGVIILYSIFAFNNGEIRLFMFLGIILGGAFYLLLFSRYVIKASVTIINIIKKCIIEIYKILSYPIKLIYKIISKPIKICVINIGKIYRQIFTKSNSEKNTNKAKKALTISKIYKKLKNKEGKKIKK